MPHRSKSITVHYGITGPVPFLDVNVRRDSPLFVDPRVIRLQKTPQPFAAQANRCTETFFDEITRCIRSERAADHRRGLELLQRFPEPKETRLGLAKNGIEGHGGARLVGQWIWGTLNNDAEALLRVGVLKLLEDLPIFVEGVGNDITSDLTTRLVFQPLADFTAQMLAAYPELTAGGHRTTRVHRQVWDPANLEWTERAVELPVAAGKPLLLVPREWVSRNLLMSAGRYYDTAMLDFIQMEEAVHDSRGKLLTTPKDRLKERPELPRGRGTILRVTHDALTKGDDLLDNFRQFVDARHQPLTDEIILSKTGA